MSATSCCAFRWVEAAVRLEVVLEVVLGRFSFRYISFYSSLSSKSHPTHNATTTTQPSQHASPERERESVCDSESTSELCEPHLAIFLVRSVCSHRSTSS
jgi:hypothetical protein